MESEKLLKEYKEKFAKNRELDDKDIVMLMHNYHELKLEQQELKNCNLQNVMPSLLDLDFKQMRKSKGLTLREVEKSIGISNAYLSQLETGKIKSPSYDTVKALYELYRNEA